MQWLASMISTEEEQSFVQSRDSSGGFPVGSHVEYFSTSQNTWIPARIAKPHADGSYDLDCKPAVPPERVRGVSQSHVLPAQIPHQPWKAEDSSLSVHSPMQLVRIRRQNNSWHFEVGEDALRFLENYRDRRVAVCTVCGPYRSGKSFLLNSLSERRANHPYFQVGSSVQGCTEGLWLWGEVGTETAREDPVLLFMDCEGFGGTESDKTKDSKLMALCMLLSSVFVMNTKGVLSEHLFNSLSLVSHFADHIQQKGQEMSHPGFLWLLRDFVLELQDETGSAFSADEYLERALRAKPLAKSDSERPLAASEVRETLLKHFPRRHCATLVQPVIDEEKLRHLQDLPQDELRPEFRAQLAEARAKLQQLARECPKTIAGRNVDGPSLAAMLRKFVDALNSNEVLSVKNAWECVQHSACAALLRELHQDTQARLQQVRNDFPMSQEKFRKVMQNEKQRAEEQWSTRAIGEEALRNEYYQELSSGIADEEAALAYCNEMMAEFQLHEALDKWEFWLAGKKTGDPEALPNLLRRGVPEPCAAWAACQGLEQAKTTCQSREQQLRELHEKVQQLEKQVMLRQGSEAKVSTSTSTGEMNRSKRNLKCERLTSDGTLKRTSKEVEVAEPKHCACNAMPALGFRRFLQSCSTSKKASKPQAS